MIDEKPIEIMMHSSLSYLVSDFKVNETIKAVQYTNGIAKYGSSFLSRPVGVDPYRETTGKILYTMCKFAFKL